MKVKLIGKTQVVNLILPPRVYGNYWITNEKHQNLINIEASNNKWIIKSNSEVKIVDNDRHIEEAILEENHFYNFVDITSDEEYRVFVGETFDSKMLLLDFAERGNLTFYIGNSSVTEEGKPNYISYENRKVHYNQIEVIRSNGVYFIRNLFPDVNVYVNNNLITECTINYGDIIFVEGLTFSFAGNILMLGTVDDKVKYVTNRFSVRSIQKLDYKKLEDQDAGELFVDDKKYFSRPPRFRQVIEKKEFTVDNPPKKIASENFPVILTLGPMVIMGMSSSIAGIMAVVSVLSGASSFKDNIASIITAMCMILTMLVFPSANKSYQKHRNEKKEALRQEKYSNYLKSIEKNIFEECENQKAILLSNNPSLAELGEIILKKNDSLWERRPEHKDFLCLRIGLGNIEPNISVNASKEHFELEEDNLEKDLRKLIEKTNIIEDVPVTLSLRDKYISALIGDERLIKLYADGLILQMLAYHSYDELKIVIFTNKNNETYWSKLKNSPYCWSDDKSMRFFATNFDEATRVSSALEDLYRERTSKDDKSEEKVIDQHYVIITDNMANASKIGIISNILRGKKSAGFSVLYLTEKINLLPGECQMFVSIDNVKGEMFAKEEVNKKHEFKTEFISTTIDAYIYHVSNIAVEPKNGVFELPNIYSFMQMYDAGNVEQLNAFNLWQKNDPTTSLSCPVGIGENGELFKLDVHEKVHGPHGLIAGMTGSGKSEFIITYILSMAVNFKPEEVQFVLIDYKGGGLAGAFENKETGEKLPHLAGTITNLDTNEINRSLSSLQSELKRRQKIFNIARDECNESTIDIYKYQKLYRDGKVKEPIAHLLIICDEFAELKSQQSEFMDELISTARIGRSLGVHLILATQKPSGVVDEQIWSNSKFRVCLKVQDKTDSNDMIKSPDAAYLKETGRFYLQVGFNEFFAKGQSAYCGAPYYESDRRKKLVDTTINFVDNVGGIVKNVDDGRQDMRGVHKGEEITNILAYLQKIGKTENIEVRKLWLDAIPEYIAIDKLKIKYNYKKEAFNINPVIGEYDAPKEQRQALLTLPLSKDGNTLIYGNVGSGKEKLITSLVYSLITTYSPEELNIFIADFGTQILRSFARAPQIGGIVSSTESDRLEMMFKMLYKIIEERKTLFASYNGSYEYYIRKSGNKVPSIVVIINGFESFYEMYDRLAEELILLTREGQKYGIIFVTTISASNNMRMKLSQNFSEKLVLQMNDEFDYRELLGRTDILPSKHLGRGLVKRESIYEFQTASIAEDENQAQTIQNAIDNLNKTFTARAVHIPTLPEVVTTSFVSYAFNGLSGVPIGVAKQSLDVLSVDLKNELSLLITSNKIKDTKRFIDSFIYELSTIKNTQVYVLDAEKIASNIANTKHFNTSFEKVFASFKENVEKFNEIYIQNDYDISSLNNYADMVFVIIGINKIKNILGPNFDSLVAMPMMLSKKLGKMNYVIVDTFDNLRKLEYDNWYKDIINSTRGIWIGNGLAEQTIIKLYGSTRSISGNIPSNFGYNVVSGNPVLFKYIEQYGDDEDYL